MRSFANEWIVPLHPDPSAPVRIVCFPHTGGTATFYRPWAKGPDGPGTAEVIAIQPPGRESRANEPAITDLQRLTRLTAMQLTATGDKRPTILFGHSGGSIYAFEVCRALAHAGVPPMLLAVSAMAPPDHPYWDTTVETLLADPAGAYRKLGGDGAIPGELEGDTEAMATFRSLINADARLLTGIGMRPVNRLPCPISAFAAEDDAIAAPRAMQGWQAWTGGPFALHRYPGDHFYIRQQFPAVLADLLHDFTTQTRAIRRGGAS
ncbi:alpha/beta fold hydrolase [Streptomyces sp. NPDC050636]|uniref:thioesterase II family protein n=1 Tax=Streptomyces sp. NPDC050636 TaxID=3154510 RepID=UPI0034378652